MKLKIALLALLAAGTATAAPPSPTVAAYETHLLNLGYPVDLVDGIFDPALRVVIRQFQADYGLPQDGYLNDTTRQAIDAAIARGLRARKPAAITEPPAAAANSAPSPPPSSMAPDSPSADAAHASTPAPDSTQGAALMLAIGYETGGDDLVKTYPAANESYRIQAGSGVFASIGLHYRLADPRFGLGLNASFKIDDETGRDQDFEMKRFPLRMLGYHYRGSLRFGLGLQYDLNPQLERGSLGTVKFDDSLGVRAEMAYGDRNFAYGLSLTALQLEAPQASSIDASALGFFLAYGF